jgi:hypothetical protein
MNKRLSSYLSVVVYQTGMVTFVLLFASSFAFCQSPGMGGGPPGMGGGLGGPGMSGIGGPGMGDMGMGMGMGMDMDMDMDMYQPSPLELAKQNLLKAKTEDGKKKAMQRISAILSKQYDAYLQSNESDLQQMERRVRNLRSQLERRKKAKKQLLTLELQRIENEAAGLVWPEAQSNQPMAPGMGVGVFGPGGDMGFSGPGRSFDANSESSQRTHAQQQQVDRSGRSFDANSESSLRSNNFESETAEKDEEVENKLRQLALASLNYESAVMHFPRNIADEDGKPLLSWRVDILPYLGDEAAELYKKFHLDEPWNSDHNIRLMEQMPEVFRHAGFESATKTVFLGFEGAGTMFEPGKQIGFGSISDGASNTILCVQANRQSAVEWTKPADISFKVGTPVTQLAESSDGKVRFALCDGSTHEILITELGDDLQHLIQRNDGNTVGLLR